MTSDLDLVSLALNHNTADDSHRTNPNPTGNALPPDIAASLSSLSASDLAMLQPFLAALTSDPSSTDMQALLHQIDSASDVADSLEARLDNLLGTLGEAEKELEVKSDGDGLNNDEKKALGKIEEELREVTEMKEVIERTEQGVDGK